MAIKESCDITIEKKEIEEAVKIYIEQKGYKIKSIHFKFGTEYDGDFDPGTTVLEGAFIRVQNNIKK